MSNYKYLRYINRFSIIIILILMGISLTVISSVDPSLSSSGKTFFTPKSLMQLRHFILGWGIFCFFAVIDYNSLRNWALPIYIITIISLIGLFFTPAVQSVHRWYRLPLIGLSVQPSEYAKLVIVIMLSFFLDNKKYVISSWLTAGWAFIIVCIPFYLILKEPDLGTALILWLNALVVFYLAKIKPLLIRILSCLGIVSACVLLTVFLGVLPFDKVKPSALKILKEYQYERLNPDNHHQRASVTSIGIGGFSGQGWRSGEFAGRGWLPYSYTDSVFSAFGEEFGFIGLLFLISLFYGLIYFGYKTTMVAKDDFGKLLSAGITVYITMHVLINISMMCGCLPITGVPLILVSYGGSSVVATMSALGILQSIYSRRLF
ncbi:MAG: FtsW/RodA/SpoVE family cell cycle protein [Victivallaceae bacterium]